MTDEVEQHYSVARVASMFDVRPATIRTWIRDKELVAIKLPSGSLRVPESAVRELANRKYGNDDADTE